MSKSNQINTARRFWGQFITAATGACSGGLGCTGSPQSLDILGHYSLEMIRGPCELQSRVTVASQEAEQGHEACKQLQPHPCRTLLRLQHAWAPAVAFGSLPPAWHAPRCRRWPRCAWRARRHRGGRSRCASTCSGQASRGQEMASRRGRLAVHTSAASCTGRAGFAWAATCICCRAPRRARPAAAATPLPPAPFLPQQLHQAMQARGDKRLLHRQHSTNPHRQ